MRAAAKIHSSMFPPFRVRTVLSKNCGNAARLFRRATLFNQRSGAPANNWILQKLSPSLSHPTFGRVLRCDPPLYAVEPPTMIDDYHFPIVEASDSMPWPRHRNRFREQRPNEQYLALDRESTLRRLGETSRRYLGVGAFRSEIPAHCRPQG